MATAAARFDEAFLRKLEALTVIAKRARGGDAGAERRGRRVGAGIELADHREYVPGDDVRALDWNLYARTGRPYVRLREEDEDLTLALILDGSASMGVGAPPKLELAARIAAAVAYIGLSSLDRVSVALVAGAVREALPPVRGRGGAARVFEMLERATADGQTDLTASARQVLAARGGTRRGLALLISDLHDPAGWLPALDALRTARQEIVVVHVTAAGDASLPPEIDGDVVLEDVETGATCELALTPAARRAHAERWAAGLRAISGACRERAITYLQIDAAIPFEDAVLRLLRTGGLLA